MAETVFGIDPALRNVGWCCWEINDTTQRLAARVAGGTLERHDASEPLTDRLCWLAETIWELLERHRPWCCVLEEPLTFGRDRNPAGQALFTLLTARLRRPTWGLSVRPRYVVTLNPSRLARLLSETGRQSPKQNLQRYRQQTGHDGPVSEHEVDAYWLASYGSRFIKTCIESSWPQGILTPVERDTFLRATRADGTPSSLLDQHRHAWWAPDDLMRENEKVILTVTR